jgi:hypothetical protein
VYIVRVIIYFIFFGFSFRALAADSVKVVFYNKELTVTYSSDLFSKIKELPNAPFPENYYKYMDNTDYLPYFNSLQSHKSSLKLNDYLYYRLLQATTDAIPFKQKENDKTILNWFILLKSGYNAKLESTGKNLTISVYTRDLVFDCPQSKFGDGFWVDITSFHNSIDYEKGETEVFKFTPNKSASPFSFSFNSIPEIFEHKTEYRVLDYLYNNQQHTLTVPYNKGYADFLNNYLEMGMTVNASYTLGEETYNALIPHLKEQTLLYPDSVDKVNFILSFVKQAFQFKKDEEAYNGNRMIFSPVETLNGQYADSEDYAVFLYFLISEILGYETIFINFSSLKHTALAINLPTPIGKPVIYSSKKFTFCITSAEYPDIKAGEYPKLFENKPYKIFDK